MVTSAGISIARAAMIKVGLSRDINGEWHVGQLTSKLQAIIARYPNNFAGEVTVPPAV